MWWSLCLIYFTSSVGGEINVECARSEREGAATGIWIVSGNTGPVCINKVLSKQRKFYSELITSAHFLYDQSENHSIGKSIFSMFDSL